MKQARSFGHAFRQPLNNIRLSVANMRMRLEQGLVQDDRAYLLDKLARIDEQLERATTTAEEYEVLPRGEHGGPPRPV